MPTLTDAFGFVLDPDTSVEQLRRACAILELDTTGDAETLRARLRDQLQLHPAEEPVVCLNPRIPA